MVRTTYNAINRRIQSTIFDRYANLTSLQEQLSTGKRLLRPSDNPTDVANTIKLRSKNKQLEQYKRNINDGLGYMQVTDTAMMSLNNILQRVRELAIQADNDTLSSTERALIFEEVDQLMRQIISVGNTKFKGDYVFGGTNSKAEPFPKINSKGASATDYTNRVMASYDGSAGAGTYQMYTGNSYPVEHIMPGTVSISNAGTVYTENSDFTIDYANGTITPINAALQVDVSTTPNYAFGAFEINFEFIGQKYDVLDNPLSHEGKVLREIESGTTEPINIGKNELILDSETNINLIDVLINFGNSLLNNNQSGILQTISDIDTSFENMLAAQAKNGSRINRFETTIYRNESQQIETIRKQSELEDADFAEIATKFSVAQTVYNAALQTSAKIIQTSLVNFL